MLCACVEVIRDRTMERRLSYTVCLLHVCMVLFHGVMSVPLQRLADECVPQLCWSPTAVSARCAMLCGRLTRLVDRDADKASMLPVVVGEPANRRSPSSRVKSRPTDLNKRYSSFVRIGRRAPPGYKRYSSFVRIGRAAGARDHPSSVAFNKRRYSSFVRIGRNGH